MWRWTCWKEMKGGALEAGGQGSSPGSHLDGPPTVLLPEVERPLVLPDGDGIVQLEGLHFLLAADHKDLHTHKQ